MADCIIYYYRCENEHSWEHKGIAPDYQEVTIPVCPVCGGTGKLRRMVSSTDGIHEIKRSGTKIVYSNALGILPEQIEEAVKLNPDEEYTPDGRMIIRGDRHREKMCDRHGLVVM